VEKAVRCQDPACNSEELRDNSLSMFRILIGANASEQRFCEAAMVSTSLSAPFLTDMTSWMAIQRSYASTRYQFRKGVKKSRVSGFNGLNTLETEIKYKFQDRGILEDAMSQLSSKFSLQGVSCQRLELLGDAILDVLIAEYILESVPGVEKRSLANFCKMSSERDILAVAAMNIKLQNHIHYAEATQARAVQAVLHALNREKPKGGAYWRKARVKNKTLCNAYESLVGAVFVDSNLDLDAVRGVFIQTLAPLVDATLKLPV